MMCTMRTVNLPAARTITATKTTTTRSKTTQNGDEPQKRDALLYAILGLHETVGD